MSHVFYLAQSVAKTLDVKFSFGQTTEMASSKRWPRKIHVWCCGCIILIFVNVVSNIMSPSFLYRSGAEMSFHQILRYPHSRHDIPASLSEMCTLSFLLYIMLMYMSQL